MWPLCARQAAAALANGAFYNTGQSCCSVERIYVADEVRVLGLGLAEVRVRTRVGLPRLIRLTLTTHTYPYPNTNTDPGG